MGDFEIVIPPGLGVRGH